MSTRLQLPGVSNTPQVFPSGFNRIRNSILCILRWMKKTHCNTVNTPDFEHPSGQGRRIHRSEIICFSMWTAWWIPLILDSPKWTYQLPEKMKNPRKRSVFNGLWWSQQDSNLWPHRCERCALTMWLKHQTILETRHAFWFQRVGGFLGYADFLQKGTHFVRHVRLSSMLFTSCWT